MRLLKPALISLVLAVLYLGLLRPFGILEIPIFRTQDLLFKIRNQVIKPPSILDQIVLIVIDDESIERSNQKWPFKRKVFADLIGELSKAKPRVTAFDFVFSGKSDPVDDFLLAHSLEHAGPVVLASFVDTNGNYILPYHEFLSKETAVGIINKVQDRDLTVRRANLVYRDREGKSVARPWELEIASVLAAKSRPVPRNDIPGGTAKDTVSTIINYRFDFGEVNSVPFWKLSQNPNLYSGFTGKIVLIGTTSKVLHDFYPTPLGLLPGVVINMNLLANLLSNDFAKPLSVFFSFFCVFLFSLLGVYLSLHAGVVTAFLSLAGASFLFLGLAFILFLNNYLFDYFAPLLFGWFSFTAISFYRYFFTLLENIQLRRKVILDPLTGLYNRRFLETSIHQHLEKKDHELSVLMVDIDNFKTINDTYGHPFGDDVIKNVSFAIKEELGEGDIAVRYGGEEFCVVLAKASKKQAAQTAERIRKRIAEHKFSYVNQIAHFTVSVGVASSKEDQLLASRPLIRAADMALYDAKKSGKNKVALFHNV